MKETSFPKSNHLFLLSIGVFVCLVILTIISLMDFRADKKSSAKMATVAMGMPSRKSVICNFCGTKGIPQCFYCGSAMGWNPVQGTFQCQGCGRIGNANCPSCGSRMRPAGNPWGPPPMQAGIPAVAGSGYPEVNPFFVGAQPAANVCPPNPFYVPQTGAPVAWPYDDGPQTLPAYPGSCVPNPFFVPKAVTPVAWPYGGMPQDVAPYSQNPSWGTNRQNNPPGWGYGNGYRRYGALSCPGCGSRFNNPNGMPNYPVNCPNCGTAMVGA